MTGDVQIPEDVSQLKDKTVVGFFGLIEEWIDLELIRFIAEQHPEWQVLMIGRVAVAHNPCEGMENVHFIGRRHFRLLPDYAAVFDVGILPYKLNRQVLNSNPIKLREYLAAGLPVVSVRFPQVENYKDVVSIADNHREFVCKIENCLAPGDSNAQSRRIESVKGETWKARVDKVLDTLEHNIGGRSGSVA